MTSKNEEFEKRIEKCLKFNKFLLVFLVLCMYYSSLKYSVVWIIFFSGIFISMSFLFGILLILYFQPHIKK